MIERPSSAHEEKAEESEHEEQDAAYFRDLALGSYKRVPVDGTFYLGDKNEVVLIRVQDKITDQRDKRRRTFRSLGPEERRSRIEIALEARSPAEFGVELPVDLGRRRFSALVNQAFRMGIPTLRMDDAGEPAKEELQIFQRAGLIGLDRFQRACHLRREIKALTDKRKGAEVRHLREKGYWRAWTEFNQRSLKAVDRLDHAWERAEARLR